MADPLAHLPRCAGCNHRFKPWEDEPADPTRCSNCQPAPIERAAEHVLTTVTELAARWHRADEDYTDQTHHTHGRQEGYLQAIALLLGQPVANVRLALKDGSL